MSIDQPLTIRQSSYSDDEENQLKFKPVLSSIDADADESDNGSNQSTKKARRLQKTHRASISSLQQKHETNGYKDDQEQSSSDEQNKNNKEPISMLNGHSDRRTKLSMIKKYDRLAQTTTTTTDDDLKEQCYHYHPLDNLESKLKISNESSPTVNPVVNASANQPTGKKINRFQVKSIHKSQQPQIILAKAAAAKSSNDDDYIISAETSKLSLKPLLVDRKHANTPTTDIENSTTNTNNIVNGVISTLINVRNQQNHVHFRAASRDKHDSTADDERSPSVTATATTQTAPAPPSSTLSAQGEVRIFIKVEITIL